jgi:alkylhydroperoxidase family enzyme
MNGTTRQQAIAIAAAIFAARDVAKFKNPREPAAARAIEEAVSKARYLIDVIERKLA